MRKTFLYYLFSERKAPYYLDQNNHVQEGNPADYTTQQGEPAHLVFDPTGWRDTLVKYARNIKYWGLTRDFTVPMKFPGDGGKILRQLMWNFGVEAICYVGISKLDRFNLPYDYLPWYVSELNFSKYNQQDKTITIEALEGGLVKYVKAFESTVYEMELATDPEVVLVTLDGMELENTATYSITDGVGADPAYDRGNHLVDAFLVQKEIDIIGGAFTVPRTKVNNLNADIRKTGQYMFKATVDGTLGLEWDFELTTVFYPPPDMNPALSLNVVFRAIKPDNTVGNTVFLLTRNWSVGQDPRGHFHLKNKANIAMKAGEELYLFTFLTVTGASGDAQMQFTYGGTEPFVKMSYTYKHSPTQAYAITLKRLGQKLLDKMTDGKYKTLVSNYLDLIKDSVLITSGDGLRGFEDAKIKISWADYFKSLFARFSVGFGTDTDAAVIEELAHFFQTTVILSLPEVKGAKLSVAEDLMGNTIKAGYKAQEYKEINGRMEFNQGQVWDLPITKIVKEIDLTSTIRADPFGIELLRMNFGQKRTTDTSSDNDCFFLSVKRNSATFTCETWVDKNFHLFRLVGQASKIALFKAGTRIQILQTQFNNGFYTVLSSAVVNNGQDISFFTKESPVQNEGPSTGTVAFLNYILNRPAYTSVTGLLHPATTFNIELSPHRGLLNNGAYLHSICDLLDSKEIKFRSSDKNGDLSTTFAGVTIRENENIKIGNLQPKLWRPYYLEFTTEVPVNLLELTKGNPYGLVEFSWRNKLYKGFIFDGGVKPGTNDVQVWKLLSAPDNDLTNFDNE